MNHSSASQTNNPWFNAAYETRNESFLMSENEDNKVVDYFSTYDVTTSASFFDNLTSGNDSLTGMPDDYHWCNQPRQQFKSLLEVVLIITIGSACDLLCIVSHIFVLLAFALNASVIFAQPGHYYLLYLVNLSVCDLAISLVSVPSRLLMDLRGCWPLGNTLCTMYQVVSWLALNGRALTYCAIAYDRYLMIAEGVAYSMKCTRKRILWRIVWLWLFTFVVYAPPHFYDVIFGTGSTRWPGQCIPEFTVDVYVFNTLIMFSNFFSPVLLAMLYVMVWMALRQRQEAAQNLKKHAYDKRGTTAGITANGSNSARPSLEMGATQQSSQRNSKDAVNYGAPSISRPLLPLPTLAVVNRQSFAASADSPTHNTSSGSNSAATTTTTIVTSSSSSKMKLSSGNEYYQQRPSSPALVHVPLLSVAESGQKRLSTANGNQSYTATVVTNNSSNSAATTRDKRAARRARRATRSMMLLTSTFLMCQLPFGLTTLTVVMCPNDWCKTSGHFIWRLLSITQYLLYFNSLLNPFLYGIAFPAVRTAIEALLPKSLVSCLRYCWSMCFSCRRGKKKTSTPSLSTVPTPTVFEIAGSTTTAAPVGNSEKRGSYRQAICSGTADRHADGVPLSTKPEIQAHSSGVDSPEEFFDEQV